MVRRFIVFQHLIGHKMFYSNNFLPFPDIDILKICFEQFSSYISRKRWYTDTKEPKKSK